jgi:hypothetical protein
LLIQPLTLFFSGKQFKTEVQASHGRLAVPDKNGRVQCSYIQSASEAIQERVRVEDKYPHLVSQGYAKAKRRGRDEFQQRINKVAHWGDDICEHSTAEKENAKDEGKGTK